MIGIPNEKELRKHRSCFTGHRPEKLHKSEEQIKNDLLVAILQAVDDGFVTFISGMARGVDIWAAEIVLRFRSNNPAIHLIAAVPYKGFESRWSKSWQDQYNFILEYADLVRYICKGYSMASFHIRNERMVDSISLRIAIYNGESDGTRNIIEYAKRTAIELVTL